MDAQAQTFWGLSLALAGCLTLGFKHRAVSGSTLIPVWWWQGVSLVAIGAASLALWAAGTALFEGRTSARYLACTTTICPLMAVLGAKRPQSRAWFAIVAALWIILAMPGIQALLFDSGDDVQLDPVRSAFLVVLILIGIVNWLPTRALVGHLLQGLGQFAMLAPFLPRDPFPESSQLVGLLGLALYVVGLAAWFPFGGWRRSARRPLNRAWLDFRDAYGLVWGVRVMDRFNQEGARQSWKIRLSWFGLRSIVPGAGAELSPETDYRMRRLLASLLRRFVSRGWVDQRLPTN